MHNLYSIATTRSSAWSIARSVIYSRRPACFSDYPALLIRNTEAGPR